MYHTIDEFIRDHQGEAALTSKVMERLTDASLSQAVVPGDRTIGWTAWHLVTSIADKLNHAGLEFASPDSKTPIPDSAAVIADSYTRSASQFLEAITAQWTDDLLGKEIERTGICCMRWIRGMVLDFLLRHEIHHRGELMVMMRQAGLKVPGIYGPSRDQEWVRYPIYKPHERVLEETVVYSMEDFAKGQDVVTELNLDADIAEEVWEQFKEDPKDGIICPCCKRSSLVYTHSLEVTNDDTRSGHISEGISCPACDFKKGRVLVSIDKVSEAHDKRSCFKPMLWKD